MGELIALLINICCMLIRGDSSRSVLRPHPPAVPIHVPMVGGGQVGHTLDTFCPSLHVRGLGTKLHHLCYQVNASAAHVEPVDISSSCFSWMVRLERPRERNVWLDDFVIASLKPA